MKLRPKLVALTIKCRGHSSKLEHENIPKQCYRFTMQISAQFYGNSKQIQMYFILCFYN